VLVGVWLGVIASATASAQTAQQPFEPTVGQAGKDVVWVPTPQVLVDRMLDMAQVSPRDFVVDLGSGDGRNVIAAAKRGARAVGFEYNPAMVELSRRSAAEAGVAERATFVEGDMFEADISQATVLALFLLPDNLSRLRAKFLELAPGTRIVMNTFSIPDWDADESEQVNDGCSSWCTSLLYFVPANVAGTWRMSDGELILSQAYQQFSGTLSSEGEKLAIEQPRLRGAEIEFTVAGRTYQGRVQGDRMTGTVPGESGSAQWSATRAPR
jgi:SAM-dependent methyltransferase